MSIIAIKISPQECVGDFASFMSKNGIACHVDDGIVCNCDVVSIWPAINKLRKRLKSVSVTVLDATCGDGAYDCFAT